MRSAKPLAALALTGVGTALVVGFQVPPAPSAATTGAAAAATTNTTSTTSTGTSTGTSTAGSTSTSPTTGTATTTESPIATDAAPDTVAVASTTAYVDGTYTGTAVEEPWGTFQVQAVISGGVITDVVVVTAPTDGHSSRINDQSVPLLTEQAIATQAADVDMISGATWTSRSYAESLQGALDEARAAAEQAG